MIEEKRPICSIDDCSTPVMTLNANKYGTLCSRHRDIKYRGKFPNRTRKYTHFSNDSRPKCSTQGCERYVKRTKYKKSGKWWYAKYCGSCYEKKRGYHDRYNGLRGAFSHGFSIQEAKELNLTKCSICGWDKANCDIHRIKDGINGGMYTMSNVMVLCPNCHRLVHRGLLKI